MVRHIVLTRFKHSTTEAEISELYRAFESLVGQLDNACGFTGGGRKAPSKSSVDICTDLLLISTAGTRCSTMLIIRYTGSLVHSWLDLQRVVWTGCWCLILKSSLR